MKHWLAWLILGTCVLLFGCQQAARDDTPSNLAPTDLPTRTADIDFCRDLDLFYNEGFALSYDEDLRLFRARIEGHRLARTRLQPEILCAALDTAIEPPDRFMAPAPLLADAEQTPESTDTAIESPATSTLQAVPVAIP